jgi:glycosyltransferase involved in cell wall biosynthesis
MKILQICSKSPYPPREGGPIAMNNITQGLLKKGHTVKVLAINTPKYFINYNEIPEDYKRNTAYESIYIDTNIKISKAFFNFFSVKSYHVERFISKEFNSKIIQIISYDTFDIIQLESIFVAPYIDTIKKYSKAKIVLRTHNIEHLIWERITNNCRNPFKKLYLHHLQKTLKKFEFNVFNIVEGIASISQVDTDFIIKHTKRSILITTIPIGIELKKIKNTASEREFPGLFHLGSMDWIPNQEGVRWFLNNVWPSLSQEFPNLSLYLAGRNMPDWIKKTKINNIKVEGEIENAYQYMQSKSILIVPLLSGSGMRVKIIEGMACGDTVISTTIGAEGIMCTNNENILIADTANEFIQQIKKCVDSQLFCKKISNGGMELVKEKYNNDTITENLIQFYLHLLQGI